MNIWTTIAYPKNYSKATHEAQGDSGKGAPLIPSMPALKEPRTQGAERKAFGLKGAWSSWTPWKSPWRFVSKAGLGCAMINWMLSSPKILYPEIPILSGVVLACGVLRRWLGQESWALLDGISAFVKETLESSLDPSATWGHRETKAICKPGTRPSSDTKSAKGLDCGQPHLHNVV